MRFFNAIAIFLCLTVQSTTLHAADIDAGISAYHSKKYAEALKILVPLANGGNDEAQRLVGEMCYSGLGMKRDVFASFKWTEIAASNGNKIAQYNLGYLYEKGEGVATSIPQAIDWYGKAARQEYVAAQHKLGDLYAHSNTDLSIYWYDKARQNGDDQAREQFSQLSNEREVARQAQLKIERHERAEEQRQEDEKKRIAELEQSREAAERDRIAAMNSDETEPSPQTTVWNGWTPMPSIADNQRNINAAVQDSKRVLAAQADERARVAAENLRIANEQAERRQSQRDQAIAQQVAASNQAEQKRIADAAAARASADLVAQQNAQRAQARADLAAQQAQQRSVLVAEAIPVKTSDSTSVKSIPKKEFRKVPNAPPDGGPVGSLVKDNGDYKCDAIDTYARKYGKTVGKIYDKKMAADYRSDASCQARCDSLVVREKIIRSYHYAGSWSCSEAAVGIWNGADSAGDYSSYNDGKNIDSCTCISPNNVPLIFSEKPK